MIKLKNAIQTYWNELIQQVPKILLGILIVIIGFLITNYIAKLFRKTISIKTKDPLITTIIY